jgi:hypothetical protein
MQKDNKKHNEKTPDIDLVRKINEDGDGESLRALSDRHAPLIASIIARLAKRFNNWAVVQDVIEERDYIVYTSAGKFNPNRNTKFSTFLGNETKWAYLNKCSAQKKTNRHIPTDSEILENKVASEEFPLELIMKQDTLGYIFRILANHPDRRMEKIFTMRYVIGKRNKVMPWHLVGRGVGLSAQGCINIHKAGINFIKEELNKEEQQYVK